MRKLINAIRRWWLVKVLGCSEEYVDMIEYLETHVDWSDHG